MHSILLARDQLKVATRLDIFLDIFLGHVMDSPVRGLVPRYNSQPPFGEVDVEAWVTAAAVAAANVADNTSAT